MSKQELLGLHEHNRGCGLGKRCARGAWKSAYMLHVDGPGAAEFRNMLPADRILQGPNEHHVAFHAMHDEHARILVRDMLSRNGWPELPGWTAELHRLRQYPAHSETVGEFRSPRDANKGA